MTTKTPKAPRASKPASKQKPVAGTARRPRRPHAVSRELAINHILDIATQEFVDKGLAGARIDEIAGRATKRKIYYYFEGKEDLYRAVLARAYRRMRESEGRVDTEKGTASDALRRLIEHDVRYHSQHPELVRLVMNENIHRAEHLKQIPDLPAGNSQVIVILRRLIERGEADGSFRKGIDPVQLHMNITALSFYNVSNQFTFAHNFGVDMSSREAVARRAREVADIILAWVAAKS
jgi:AcrR family transcriptional regulator